MSKDDLNNSFFGGGPDIFIGTRDDWAVENVPVATRKAQGKKFAEACTVLIILRIHYQPIYLF